MLFFDFIRHHSQQDTQVQVNVLMYNTSLMPSLCITNIVSYICTKESEMGELLKQARESLIIKFNIKDPKSLMKGLKYSLLFQSTLFGTRHVWLQTGYYYSIYHIVS